MKLCPVPGINRSIQGARYFSQSTMTLKNLSSPKAMGATVKAIRRSVYAWWPASRRSERAETGASFAAAFVGYVVVAISILRSIQCGVDVVRDARGLVLTWQVSEITAPPQRREGRSAPDSGRRRQGCSRRCQGTP